MHVSALEFPVNSLPHTEAAFLFFCPSFLHSRLLNKSAGWPGWDITHRDQWFIADSTGEMNLIPERNEDWRTHNWLSRSHLLAASLICFFLRLSRCRHQIHRHFIFEKEFYVHDNAQASYPPSAAKITHCCTEFSDSVRRKTIFCAISTLSRPFCSQSSPRFLLCCTSSFPSAIFPPFPLNPVAWTSQEIYKCSEWNMKTATGKSSRFIS